MKRRSKKTRASCRPCSLKGSIRSDRMLVAGLAIVILASIVVIGSVLHLWKGQFRGEKEFSQSANVANLQVQIDALKKEVAKSKAGATSGVPNSAATAQTTSAVFEKAVNDKDFSKIDVMLATRVYYVIDSSDCCGDITKKEAAANLKNYIQDVKSFNFDQNQQVVKQMKVNLADTFAKYTIGIADNKMVLSYHLDAQGKVDDLMLSASHLMYDLE
jgi:hypothetical protein